MYSIICPTMWKCPQFIPYLNYLLENYLVSELIIINNDINNTPKLPNNKKIILVDLPFNIMVNSSWNLGIQISKNNLICLMNDDIQFDTSVFDFLKWRLTPKIGIIGLDISMKDVPYTLEEISERPFGFGSLMFFHFESYKKIPNQLKFFFGDDWLLNYNTKNGKKNYILNGLKFSTEMSVTSKNYSIYSENEEIIFNNLKESL